MTVIQAVKEIKKVHKWYAITESEKDQVLLRMTALNILKGTAKQKTIETFLNRFGYEITTNVRPRADITKRSLKSKGH